MRGSNAVLSISNTDTPIRSHADRARAKVCRTSYKELAAVEVEVGLPILGFGNWGHQSPCQAKIQCQIGSDAPRVLHKGANHFPATARRSSEECLIVDATAQLAEQEISRGIAGEAEVDKEAVLERVGLYVHLLIAEAAADLDVVLAANHVERVRDLEDVGAALEGSEAAIAQAPSSCSSGWSSCHNSCSLWSTAS